MSLTLYVVVFGKHNISNHSLLNDVFMKSMQNFLQNVFNSVKNMLATLRTLVLLK
jgi:hypothetical protein